MIELQLCVKLIVIRYSCIVPLIELAIAINTAGVINWLDPLVDHAEKDVNDDGSQINPEEVLKCLS